MKSSVILPLVALLSVSAHYDSLLAGPKPSAVSSILELTSPSWRKSSKAPQEIYAKGAQMIPALMELKGNQKPFAASWALFAFTTNCQLPHRDDITIEVTALFLIDAIFQERFATPGSQCPWLHDYKMRGREGGMILRNTDDLVRRAWISTEIWYGELQEKGIEQMRKENRGPLSKEHLYFW